MPHRGKVQSMIFIDFSGIAGRMSSLANLLRDLGSEKKQHWRSGLAGCIRHSLMNVCDYPWRIHGAGIYANIKGVYWWDPWHTIYSSTMDPSWAIDLFVLKSKHKWRQNMFCNGALMDFGDWSLLWCFRDPGGSWLVLWKRQSLLDALIAKLMPWIKSDWL